VATHQADAALRQEILDVEARRVAAMVQRDLASLDSILADDLTYTHSGGMIDDKASFLALIDDTETSYLGVDFYPGVEVIPCGEGAVLVRGKAQIRLERATGEKPSYPVWFVDVFAKRDGQWRLIAWQATRAPESSA
jgi:hypothetical protein